MAIDTSTPKTRRALLAGALGGGLALVAHELVRPGVALASDDGLPLLMGHIETSSGLTGADTSGKIGLVGASSSSSSGDSFGVLGHAKSPTGGTAGVQGRADSVAGIGVRGTAIALTGGTVGVYGVSASNAGAGVSGVATSSTGDTPGVYGRSDSTAGKGVVGVATATTGGTVGVYGTTDSVSGYGVYGIATSATGATIGVFGTTNSAGGQGVNGNGPWGVVGNASTPGLAATAGFAGHDAAGVFGWSFTSYPIFSVPTLPAKTGVFGLANQDSGSVGVKGRSSQGSGVIGSSTSGIGVQGVSQSSRGVYGQSDTDLAIYGYNTGTETAILGYGQGGTGVRGHTTGSSAPAIVGHAYGTPTGVAGISGPGDDPPLPDKTGVFGFANQDAGASGVRGRSPQGTGVIGSSNSGIGTQGISGSSLGVYGQSDTDLAVYGYNTTSGTAILGYGQTGEGVRGHTTGSAAPAIVGHAYTGTTGVAGISGGGNDPSLPLKTGLFGYASNDTVSVGVRGFSPTGRGGLFTGKVAQMRLNPSAASTHPASGLMGDVFVDTSGRLWFCKGGTSWKQLA